MKKVLLSAVAIMAAMSLNAQEMCQVNADALGVGSDAVALDPGTVIASSDNVTISAAFADTWKKVTVNGPKVNESTFQTVTYGTLEMKGDGIQGQSNPKDAAGNNPATPVSVPAEGSVFKATVNNNGFLYVIHKASSHKNYTVFEDGAALAYKFVMATDGAALPKVFGYDLAADADKDGYLPSGYTIAWPEVIYTKDETSAVKTNGLSVIKFPVFKGSTYFFNACGSKMSLLGCFFDTTGDATITITNGGDAPETWTLLEKGEIPAADPQGIAGVKAEKVNGAIFNLAGQKVTANFKGIAIQNGKKVVLK